MKRLAVLAVALLAGCASFPPSARADDTDQAAKSLSAVVSADLDAAVKIANENADPYGAKCAIALKAWLVPPAAPVSSAPKTAPAGVFSAYEAERVKVKSVEGVIAKIKAGAPVEVVEGCAVVTHDAKALLLKLGAIASGAAK